MTKCPHSSLPPRLSPPAPGSRPDSQSCALRSWQLAESPSLVMRGKLFLSIVDALIQLAIGPPLAAPHPRRAPHRAPRRAASPRPSPRPSTPPSPPPFAPRPSASLPPEPWPGRSANTHAPCNRARCWRAPRGSHPATYHPSPLPRSAAGSAVRGLQLSAGDGRGGAALPVRPAGLLLPLQGMPGQVLRLPLVRDHAPPLRLLRLC